ncbi:MAG: CheR family methyltransferase [Pseudomonadota bacterium]
MTEKRNILFDPPAALVIEGTGLAWNPSGRTALEKFAARRMEALHLGTPSDYQRLLETDPEEWDRLIPKLTDNRTGFFRNMSQFEALEILWNNQAQYLEERKLTMVSLGCGTGEELYSLCIHVRESGLTNKGWLVETFGADINPESIDQARSGLYSPQDLEILGRARVHRWFRPHAGKLKARDILQEMASWSVFNLIAPDEWPWPEIAGRVDVLLMRNVLSGLAPEAVRKAEELAARLLAPAGILVSEPTEGLALDPSRFSPERLSGLIFHRRLDKKVKANPGRASRRSPRDQARTSRQVTAPSQGEPLKMAILLILDQGRRELEAGRYEQAFPYWEEVQEAAAAQGEISGEALGLAARTHLFLNRPRDAEELAGRVNSFSEERPWCHMLQGEARRKLGRDRQARESWLRAEEMLSRAPEWLAEPYFRLDPIYDAPGPDGPLGLVRRLLAELDNPESR